MERNKTLEYLHQFESLSMANLEHKKFQKMIYCALYEPTVASEGHLRPENETFHQIFISGFALRFQVILHQLHRFYALDNLHAKVPCFTLFMAMQPSINDSKLVIAITLASGAFVRTA